MKLMTVVMFGFILAFAGTATNVAANDKEKVTEKAAEKTDGTKKLVDNYNNKQKHEARKLICKYETELGSRFKKKVCRTAAAIEKERRDNKNLLDNRTRVLTEPTS